LQKCVSFLWCTVSSFIFRHSLPNTINQISPRQVRGDIEKDSGAVPGSRGDAFEHFLPHGVIGADVEHVDIAVRVKNDVEYRGEYAAGKIKKGAAGKFPGGVFLFRTFFFYLAETCRNAEDDEQHMPQIGVDGQGRIGIVKAACVKKGEDSAHQPESLKERQEHPPGILTHERQQKADIHGYAAELEREMPPVIAMFIYDKCNAVLFPDFAEKHEYSAKKEKP